MWNLLKTSIFRVQNWSMKKKRKNAADCSIVQSFMEFMKFFIFSADFFLICKIPSQIGETNLEHMQDRKVKWIGRVLNRLVLIDTL